MMRRIILLALASVLLAPASLGQGLRVTPLGFCSLGTLTSAVGITTTTCVFASFTATLSTAGVLNVTAVGSGTIRPGQPLTGTSVPSNAFVQGQLSGTTGGVGTYRVTNPPTTAITSESMTTAGIPVNANYATLCATAQNINYRDDGTAATATAGSGGQFIPSGQCIPATTTFSLLSFFQQAGGATLGVNFYAWQ